MFAWVLQYLVWVWCPVYESDGHVSQRTASVTLLSLSALFLFFVAVKKVKKAKKVSGKKKQKQEAAESVMAELPFTNTEVCKELGCECTLAPRTTAELTYLLKRRCEAAPVDSSHLPGGGIIVWSAAELRDDVCMDRPSTAAALAFKCPSWLHAMNKTFVGHCFSMVLTVSEHAPVSDANVFTTNDNVSIGAQMNRWIAARLWVNNGAFLQTVTRFHSY